MTNSLKEFSDALAAQTTAAHAFTAEIGTGRSSHRSGTLWRADTVVTSEQSLPKAESYEVTVAQIGPVRATLAGRDPGTNVALLKLDKPLKAALPAAAEAQSGAIALAFGADGHGGIAARLGLVSSVGPEWRSRAGGKIDRRITLDLALSHREDGGPVIDAAGHLLGVSTLGYGDTVLAIPPSTVERSVEHLLAHGSVERGWLGVALQPVAIPDAWRETAEEKTGLMVMSTVEGGPAAAADVLPGDILITIDGGRACDVRELCERLGPDSVGREVEIGLLRAGARVSQRATIATRPADG